MSGRERALAIIPMQAPIGAEIRGVDLSQPLDDGLFSEIEAAFDRYSVIFFRNQAITPEQQLAFSRRFGEVEINAFNRFALEGYPGILKVSNIKVDGKDIGYADAGTDWHSDMSYTATPPRLTMLYAHEVPMEDGRPLGPTLFASATAAYDGLPRELKARLDRKRAIHSFTSKRRGVKKPVSLTAEQIAKNPNVAHPLFRTHPRTGRKAIYVTADECIGIEGMTEAEARPIIAHLAREVLQPQHQYRHDWQVGDLLMWDNAAVQHIAIRDYEWPQRRMMHRITVAGSVPF